MVFSDYPMKLIYREGQRPEKPNGVIEASCPWKSRSMIEYIINMAGVKTDMGDIGNMDAGPKSKWAADTISEYAKNLRWGLLEGEDPDGIRIMMACFRVLRRDEALPVKKDLELIAAEGPHDLVRALAKKTLATF